MGTERIYQRKRLKSIQRSWFLGTPSSQKMQYFHRSHYVWDFKSLCALSVITLCLLQLALPTCSATKSRNEGRILNSKIGSRDVNRKYENGIPSTAPEPAHNTGKNDHDDPDVVRFGEDCSSEGPFCDESRHLICDPIDETCICDEKNGYIHINNVPGGMEQHLLIQYDEKGHPFYDMSGNVCISKEEIVERTEILLSLGKKQQEFLKERGLPSLTLDPSDVNEYDNADKLSKDENDFILKTSAKTKAKADSSEASNSEGNSIYEKFVKIAEEALIGNSDYDEKRLKRFQLNSKLENVHKSEKGLIIEEILKYRRGPIDLEDLKPYLNKLLDTQYAWRANKLSNSICSSVFDIDQDGIFTHEEYVIASFSEKIRELLIPKVFLHLIGPLIEENCISMEDLQALDHNPDTFTLDFYVMDVNKDACFSEEEFSKYVNETCWVNWLTDFLRETDLKVFLEIIDPTPEEMYVRRLMQNEKLEINWKIVDKDNDGLISINELYSDLAHFGFALEESKLAAKTLMERLDKNNDDMASLHEVKLQMSVPELTETYQIDWLESLYELFETDEDEVKDYLEILNATYTDKLPDEEMYDSVTTLNETKVNRIFIIFDRNKNSELDEVEFKLLMEMLKKFVVYDILNSTIDTMDMDSDRKITYFEYHEFFSNTSTTFRIYFKNLLALEDEIEDIENGRDVDVDEEEYNTWGNDAETDEGSEAQISSTKLSKRAALSNETLMIYKLFNRLDVNMDGFITNEDFYTTTSSYKAIKSANDLKEEFMQLDLDNDGVLTIEDGEDYVMPINFEKYKEVAGSISEDVFPSHFKLHFSLMDQNKDGIIQTEEFQRYRYTLFDLEDETKFLEWIEDYLAKVPEHTNVGAEKAFAEFDTNCDRFISKTEFIMKLEDLRKKSETFEYMLKLERDSSVYFNSVDMNRDEKVSYNEFLLLLLRTGRRLNAA